MEGFLGLVASSVREKLNKNCMYISEHVKFGDDEVLIVHVRLNKYCIELIQFEKNIYL